MRKWLLLCLLLCTSCQNLTVLDTADHAAAEYFLKNFDHNERMLFYNGRINDVSGLANHSSVEPNQTKLISVVGEGKDIVIFHNHSPSLVNQLPSEQDFISVAGLNYRIWSINPKLKIEHRMMQPRLDGYASTSYGLSRTILEGINRAAKKDYELLDALTKQDLSIADAQVIEATRRQLRSSWSDIIRIIVRDVYTKFIRPGCPSFNEYEQCISSPEEFAGKSDRYYIRFRGIVAYPWENRKRGQ